MPLILGTNSIKDTGYDVANSCRFDGSSDYMHKTPGSAGNRRTFTLSAWIKRGAAGSTAAFNGTIFGGGTGTGDYIQMYPALNKFVFYNESPRVDLKSNALLRDHSAWYNLIVAVDTTQAVEANRVKMYINGTQVTSFSTSTYPSQNDDLYFGQAEIMSVGTLNYTAGLTDYFDGYMAELVYIDGLQLAPTSFGEFNEDTPTVFQPIDVSGLTFGTNGFYLDFEDSSNLGNDANGGTDLTEVNLAATDQASDSPTNNFATLNFLDNHFAAHTFSEGNCKIVTHSGNMSFNTATIAVSSGLWYVEAKVIDNADSNYHHLGITETPSTATSNWIGLSATHYGLTGYDGKYWRGNSGTSYGVSNTTNDIVGMYIDLNANKLYFAKNGTVMNSGTGISITAAASTTNGYYFISYGDWENASTATWEVNFGSPTYSVSSSNSDPNGYGSFEYSTTITGDGSSKSFYALCTKNLAEYG